MKTTLATIFGPRARRGLTYLFVVLPIDLLSAVVLLLGGLAGGILLLTPLGAWLLAAILRAAVGLGGYRRALAARLLGEQVPTPSRATSGLGAFGWRRAVLSDPVGWRVIAYALIKPPVAVLSLTLGGGFYVYGLISLISAPFRPDALEPQGIVVLLVGVLLLFLGPWMVQAVLAVERLLIRGLLGPSRTSQRMDDLRDSRDRAVKDNDITLRRLERDLHDGAQARMIGVGMHLAMARELITARASTEHVLAVIDTAQDTLAVAVAELRDLVRGIHPPVLDNGLEAALDTVAAGSAVPVTIETNLPRRPPPALESIAYFTVCELLTNAGRHSGARKATIRVDLVDEVLVIRVHDDGSGGAFQRAGGGLAGLTERIRVVDGQLTIDSPAGGPTTITVEIPCPVPV
ncbi:sensor histidine kinase [Actinoplanes couchii]|uniref:histidine kinase n=1 Tax=Actinoplanes couchii TaxID=403638 RepID=A0ABQ3XFY3_9ACTN|nr:sensor histidine kinase [Actinoplanes couchii]MDR6320891.1 signal transduction histidine kinase [Actinoplanes couchii]GID57404.1 histidine kinase [Actinoplanes couchii]